MSRLLLAVVLMLSVAGCSIQFGSPLAPAPVKPSPKAQPTVQVLDFTATWCKPCQVNAPKIDAIEREGVSIIRYDFDQHVDLVAKYAVNSVPTYIVMKNGREYKRTGDPDELRQFLAEANGKAPQLKKPNRFDEPRIPFNERPINDQLWSAPSRFPRM